MRIALVQNLLEEATEPSVPVPCMPPRSRSLGRMSTLAVSSSSLAISASSSSTISRPDLPSTTLPALDDQHMRRVGSSIKEYAAIQEELGSCAPDFRDAVLRSFKFGLLTGVPVGFYVTYRSRPLNGRAFVAGSVTGWMATTICFSMLGIIIEYPTALGYGFVWAINMY
ncbi:hypothetical protein DICVIV_07009 [Dictyocaulus viviparus]|uniref:Uncharacterized protein n=1 Tax=Dictyocaulus viviparus TaxID=29172 RepID=A0A0D8XT41_DICVI|nr:hypothetical protein DICVIV_07009 [Dictyocaulus viviparus]